MTHSHDPDDATGHGGEEDAQGPAGEPGRAFELPATLGLADLMGLGEPTPAGSRRPDADQREAARALEIRKRLREIEEEILARWPESHVVPTLDRVARVMELLGDPHRAFPVVHLTGTNGKTSTTRMVERILREHGLRTGRFTSPHLHDLRERIALDGEPIDAERLVRTYADVLPYLQMVDAEVAAAAAAGESDNPQPLTYFEVMVVLAYAAFADAPVDVAVVEVGLGGRWDATNVADGTVAVVTPVDLDHQRFLGSTVEEIATEKAGIIKPGAIAVVAAQGHEEAGEVLLARCEETGARAVLEGREYGVVASEVAVGGQLLTLRGLAGEYPDLLLPLFGGHQGHNLASAVAACEAFLGGGEQPLQVEILRSAVAGMSAPGRLEIVRRSPTVIVDAAHNPHGAAALRDALGESFTFHRLIGLVAVLDDKDAEAILETLEPVLDHVVISRTTSPRAMPPQRLGALAEEIYGEGRVTVVESLPDALDAAGALADEGGVAGGVLATGSVVTAAEVRMLLGVTDV